MVAEGTGGEVEVAVVVAVVSGGVGWGAPWRERRTGGAADCSFRVSDEANGVLLSGSEDGLASPPAGSDRLPFSSLSRSSPSAASEVFSSSLSSCSSS